MSKLEINKFFPILIEILPLQNSKKYSYENITSSNDLIVKENVYSKSGMTIEISNCDISGDIDMEFNVEFSENTSNENNSENNNDKNNKKADIKNILIASLNLQDGNKIINTANENFIDIDDSGSTTIYTIDRRYSEYIFTKNQSKTIIIGIHSSTKPVKLILKRKYGCSIIDPYFYNNMDYCMLDNNSSTGLSSDGLNFVILLVILFCCLLSSSISSIFLLSSKRK